MEDGKTLKEYESLYRMTLKKAPTLTTFDDEAKALYVYLDNENRKSDRQIRLQAEIILDISGDKVTGIEVLLPSQEAEAIRLLKNTFGTAETEEKTLDVAGVEYFSPGTFEKYTIRMLCLEPLIEQFNIFTSQLATEIMKELGVGSEVLKRTGWNPFPIVAGSPLIYQHITPLAPIQVRLDIESTIYELLNMKPGDKVKIYITNGKILITRSEKENE